MRWSVYAVLGGTVRELEALGYVNAPHQPAALQSAWRKWPDKLQPGRVQAGFMVRIYATDHASLGKLGRVTT